MILDNLNYKTGETICILYQEGNEELGFNERFKNSKIVAEYFFNELNKLNIPCFMHYFIPEITGNGVDAPKDIYNLDADIFIMPTAFSLTHTDFAKHLVSKGSRIASMPAFTLNMISTLNSDIVELKKITLEKAELLKTPIRIVGYKTDIKVVPNINLIHTSTGLINDGINNLPGSEAFAVPISGEGYFTVKIGWGGSTPLEKEVTFFIEGNRFKKIECSDSFYAKKIWDEYFSKKDFNVFAEIGIGTNPNVTSKLIEIVGWSTLLAEKIFGSVHFANGNSACMGGNNDVPMHQDWVVPNVKIEKIDL